MCDQTVTLYNYHEPTKLWHTAIFRNVTLTDTRSSSASQHGTTSGDAVELLIPAAGNRTVNGLQYIGPKEYAARDSPDGCFTFRPEQDFVVLGDCPLEEPVSEDDYDNGLYHEMNKERDGVYLITASSFYSLIPHFEVEGR